MSWTQFLIYLGITYLVYYALMIVLDSIKAKSVAAAKGGESEENLTFNEDVEAITVEDGEPAKTLMGDEEGIPPGALREGIKVSREHEILSHDEIMPLPEAEVEYSAGVSIQGLFKLAKEEAIELTKNVAY